MAQEQDAWVGRDPRYRLAEDSALKASVLRKTSTSQDTLDAQLLDISREGVKLLIDAPLAFEEVVQLQLVNQTLDLDLRETTRVRWIREDKETGSWIVGCSIEDEIPTDILEDLIECGLLDRRHSERTSVTKDALAYWELRDEPIPVRLLNLSKSGFCLATDEPCVIGARLQLTLADDAGESSYEIRARATWQEDFEKGYLIGCEMVGDESVELLNYCTPDPAASGARNEPRRSKWLFVSAAVTGAILLALYVARQFS